MQMLKQLKKAARRADGLVRVQPLNTFNPVAPKGLTLASVSVVSQRVIVVNLRKP